MSAMYRHCMLSKYLSEPIVRYKDNNYFNYCPDRRESNVFDSRTTPKLTDPSLMSYLSKRFHDKNGILEYGA
jgi:hypothetical protein